MTTKERFTKRLNVTPATHKRITILKALKSFNSIDEVLKYLLDKAGV